MKDFIEKLKSIKNMKDAVLFIRSSKILLAIAVVITAVILSGIGDIVSSIGSGNSIFVAVKNTVVGEDWNSYISRKQCEVVKGADIAMTSEEKDKIVASADFLSPLGQQGFFDTKVLKDGDIAGMKAIQSSLEEQGYRTSSDRQRAVKNGTVSLEKLFCISSVASASAVNYNTVFGVLSPELQKKIKAYIEDYVAFKRGESTFDPRAELSVIAELGRQTDFYKKSLLKTQAEAQARKDAEAKAKQLAEDKIRPKMRQCTADKLSCFWDAQRFPETKPPRDLGCDAMWKSDKNEIFVAWDGSCNGIFVSTESAYFKANDEDGAKIARINKIFANCKAGAYVKTTGGGLSGAPEVVSEVQNCQ